MKHAPFLLRVERPAPGAPTRRACEAARLFGLSLEPQDHRARSVEVQAPSHPGAITLFAGPSGSGKSTALRTLEAAAEGRDWHVLRPERLRLGAVPAVQLFGRATLDESLRVLCAAGLADAHAFVRRPSELSEGQRFRLRLAVACRRALERASPTLLSIDEFATTLDRTTAVHVAASLRRLCAPGGPLTAAGVRCVVATSHDDIATRLAPDLHSRFSLSGSVENIRSSGQSPGSSRYTFQEGAVDDYHRLGWCHYRAGVPATVARVLRAVAHRTGQLAGVLVVSMPTLNAGWRGVAWPGRFSTGDKRADASRINAELRCISRVVVDPRHRNVGLATRLVRAYLENPLTPCTEAIAAMGRWSPFFRSAGMTRYLLPPSPRDARFLDAMSYAGVEPWRLATPRAAYVRAVRGSGEGFVHREIRRWASSSRTPKAIRSHDGANLFQHVCRSVVPHSAAFAHTAPRVWV